MSLILAVALLLSTFPAVVFAGPEDDYAVLVAQVEGLIAQAEALVGSDLPETATYDEIQYAQAIDNFIAGAQRDLAIADALLTDDGTNGALLALKGEAATWLKLLAAPEPDVFYSGSWRPLLVTYQGWGSTPEKRQANALAFLQEGGYANTTIGTTGTVTMQFNSSFHPQYSSGLLGLGANKVSAVEAMEGTLEDLVDGMPYDPMLRAKARFEAAKAQLQYVKANPESILEDVLANEANLAQLVNDLDTLLGSLDTIVDIIDLIGTLGLGNETINTFLQPLGLNMEMLEQLGSLRDLLVGLGFDTSGNTSVQESMGPLLSGILTLGIDEAIWLQENTASLLGTPLAWRNAAQNLENHYQTITSGAIASLNLMLGPVMSMIEPIRPYLDILASGVRLFNDALMLLDNVNRLLSDFSLGNLSGVGYSLANTLDDFADLLAAFARTGLSELLPGLLDGTDLGGMVTDGITDLINSWLSTTILSGVAIPPGGLSTIGSLLNSLGGRLLGSPNILGSLLRATAGIIRSLAGYGIGIEQLFTGNFQQAFATLSNEFGTIIPNLINVWNSLVALFSSPAAVPAEVAAVSDELPAIMQASLVLEAQETAMVLSSSSVPVNQKQAKLTEFRSYLSGIRECISDLRSIVRSLEEAKSWSRTCMDDNDSKLFSNLIVGYYAMEIKAIFRDGITCHNVIQVNKRLKALNCEIVDMLRFVKGESLVIIATPIEGVENEHYVLTTNYDALLEQLSGLFACLGISTGYELVFDSSGGKFYLDGNIVKSHGDVDIVEMDIESVMADLLDLEPAAFDAEALAESAEGAHPDHYALKVHFNMYFEGHHKSCVKVLAKKWLKPGKDEPVELVTVTFDPNGGEPAPLSIQVPVGTVIQLPMIGLTGYKFLGWHDGSAYVGGAGVNYTVEGDVTLTAYWELIDNGNNDGPGDADDGKVLPGAELPLGDTLSTDQYLAMVGAALVCVALAVMLSKKREEQL